MNIYTGKQATTSSSTRNRFNQVRKWMAQRNIRFTYRDLRLILSHTQSISIPKHSIIMPQGKAVTRLFFINDGIVRLMRQHTKGDATLAFVPAHEFAALMVYILNEQPSPCALETITDVQALHWSREDVLYLREHLSVAAEIEAAMLERLLSWNQDRELDIMNYTPEERYIKLMREQPEVIHRVPLKYIASFLGIHHDSLSRIRNKVARKS